MIALSVNVVRLRPSAIHPRYMSRGAAGVDLCAAIDEPRYLAPRQRAAIGTGWAIEIPSGYEGQVRPRSGLANRHGVTVANAPGTIDPDYRGEVIVLLINLGYEVFAVYPGDRIAQLVIAPVETVALCEVDELSATQRGSGGLGSTGVR